MCEVDITIFMDALRLLLSDKTDIKAEVRGQLEQGDDWFFDQISGNIEEEAEKAGLNEANTQKLLDKFTEDAVESLMNYISIDEEKITFDYGEAAACEDLKCVAFCVPCKFDTHRYITDSHIV